MCLTTAFSAAVFHPVAIGFPKQLTTVLTFVVFFQCFVCLDIGALSATALLCLVFGDKGSTTYDTILFRYHVYLLYYANDHRILHECGHGRTYKGQPDSLAHECHLWITVSDGVLPQWESTFRIPDTSHIEDGSAHSHHGYASMHGHIVDEQLDLYHISHIVSLPAWRVLHRICLLLIWGSRDVSRGALAFWAFFHLRRNS